MKKSPKTTTQYAVIAAIKSVVSASKSRVWAQEARIRAELPIDTRTLRATLKALVADKVLKKRTLRNGAKGYSLCGLEGGSDTPENAILQKNHNQDPQKPDALNIYIKRGVSEQGGKSEGKEDGTEPLQSDEKFKLAAEIYPHRRTEKGLHLAHKKWKLAVAHPDDGGDGISPDFLIETIRRYAALPIEQTYRVRFDNFISRKIFLDFATETETGDELVVLSNPYEAVQEISERIAKTIPADDVPLEDLLMKVGFVKYHRATGKVVLAVEFPDDDKEVKKRLFELENHYISRLSDFFGEEIISVVFNET